MDVSYPVHNYYSLFIDKGSAGGRTGDLRDLVIIMHTTPRAHACGHVPRLFFWLLPIALAFENCVDLAHAPLAFYLWFYTAILYGVYVGQRSHATRRLFKRKCNQQYY